MSDEFGEEFTVQWHVTNRCDNSCKHCYIDERSEDLDFSNLKKIFDDLYKTIVITYGKNLILNFTGGDPLMRDDFLKLLDEIQKPEVQITIMGNANRLTPEIAKKLKKKNVSEYQLSLDGLKKTHDHIRKAGSFDTTIKGIKILKEAGIKVKIMLTVSRININEIKEVMEICHQTGVDLFTFESLIPSGRGKKMVSELLKAEEFGRLMHSYSEWADEYIKKGSATLFTKKQPLGVLSDFEEGKISKALLARKLIFKGCSLGISSVAICPNGDVMACRRLPIIIGKFPEQIFEEVFFGNKMNGLRQENNLEECSDCSLFALCRGCRARALAINHNFLAKDPLCWLKTRKEAP